MVEAVRFDSGCWWWLVYVIFVGLNILGSGSAVLA
jgi:hypothetical protein